MPRDIYLEGQSVAYNQVKKYMNQIYAAKTSEEIGNIAGQAMLEITIKEDFIVHNTFGRTQSWREGFFDGFCDRAGEFKKKLPKRHRYQF